MIRVHALVIISLVAPDTSRGRVDIVATVASGTVRRYEAVSTCEWEDIVVIGECRRHPVRFGSMAGGAVCREAGRNVIGIRRLIIVCLMTVNALGRRAGISRSMAADAVDDGMRTGQRECCVVMIKCHIRVAHRMTGKARLAVVSISVDPQVCIVSLGICMAGHTGEVSVVGRIGVALNALAPLTFMVPAVDGEVLSVVIEGGRYPVCLIVTCCTVRVELCRRMVGVRRLIVLIGMASEAGRRRIHVITGMTGHTVIGDSGMCP